jgi:hypothetical protein
MFGCRVVPSLRAGAWVSKFIVVFFCAQAGDQTVSCGDATLLQQEKNTRHMSRRLE